VQCPCDPHPLPCSCVCCQGEVFLELAGSLQTRGLHSAGGPFQSEKKRAQALELQGQASVEAASASR
jgi:hypothetical protein